MRDFLVLAIHLVVTLAKLLRPGGAKAVAAESLVLKQQLIISNRGRSRAPNLANLRVPEIDEIKSVPHVPVSHPFVERLIGAIRREYLDQTLFWNRFDLARKLNEFRDYYNAHRVHRSLGGSTPPERAGGGGSARACAIGPLHLAQPLPRAVSDPGGGLNYEFATHRPRLIAKTERGKCPTCMRGK